MPMSRRSAMSVIASLALAAACQMAWGDGIDVGDSRLATSTGPAADHNNVGVDHVSKGRLREGIRELEQAVDLEPTWGLAYANLSLAYLEKNRHHDALKAGERAITLGERTAFTHTVLARIHLKQGGMTGRWRSCARRWRSIQPTLTRGSSWLGSTSCRAGLATRSGRAWRR